MKSKNILLMAIILPFFMPMYARAMHIAEGFLPPMWCIFYFIIAAPFFYKGLKVISLKTKSNKDLKMLLALVAAYCFVLSSMKLPSVGGSSSHPTGTGLGAIIFGPFIMSVIGTIVLVFQALLMGHGGITTLGANSFSMAVAGPITAYLAYISLKNKNRKAAIFLSAFVGDLSTYIVTSLQLAAAYPSKYGGIGAAFIKFGSVFAITQIPLAILEGVFTVAIFSFIEKHSKSELISLGEGE